MRTVHTLSDSTINTAREISTIAAQGQRPYRITVQTLQHPATRTVNRVRFRERGEEEK